jgi:hypothetical protein
LTILYKKYNNSWELTKEDSLESNNAAIADKQVRIAGVKNFA